MYAIRSYYEGAKRIKRIVEDLKDFARRKDDLASELFDINTAVSLAVRLVEVSIRKATENFVVSYGESLPPVRGHSQRIEQVVVNLILNACQALTDPGCRRRAHRISCPWDSH